MDSKWNFLDLELVILLGLSLSCWDVRNVRQTCSWYAFVLYSATFLHLYERKDQSFLILRMEHPVQKTSKIILYDDNLTRDLGELKVNPEWQSFDIIGVSRGLLCLRLKEKMGFVIWNPIAGFFYEVPEVPPPTMGKGKEKMEMLTRLYGFFYDMYKDDYLLFVVSISEVERTTHAFSLKALDWVEEYRLPYTVFSELLQLRQLRMRRSLIGASSAQCCAWLIGASKILIFRIRSGNFTLIPFPFSMIKCVEFALLQLNGKLALVGEFLEIYHNTIRASTLDDAADLQWRHLIRANRYYSDRFKLSFTKNCTLLATDDEQKRIIEVKDGDNGVVHRLRQSYYDSPELVCQMFQYQPTLFPLFRAELDFVKQLANKYQANEEGLSRTVDELKLE